MNKISLLLAASTALLVQPTNAATSAEQLFENKVARYQHNIALVRSDFSKCQSLEEKTMGDKLVMNMCPGGKHDEVMLLKSFDLGTWSGAYSQFALRGGQKLRTIGRDRAEVGSCRRGNCTYFSVSSIVIPASVLFDVNNRRNGLDIGAFGGPRELVIHIEPERIEAFYRMLVDVGVYQTSGH